VVIGALVILLTPQVMRRVGLGLPRDLDLPAGRVAAEVLPAQAEQR